MLERETLSEPLIWNNDPILFDAEPLPVNQWLNANELIQNGHASRIYHADTQLLNLYPIMVRKNDFVRVKTSDRIMARFPYLVIDNNIQEQIKNKILLISEITRDYFYKSVNKSIVQWKEDILKYLKRGTLPYPVVRCCFELVPNLNALINETSLRFTSARGEAFKMPTKLTKELAYLAGMVNGDGNLQKYTLRIVDYSIKNIKQLQGMFEEYFNQTGNILYKTPNSPEVIITNLWVVRFFSFLTSQPIGTKKYDSLKEPMIFIQEPFRSYYWSGVMDADGSYKKRNVRFVSASKKFTLNLQTYFQEQDIITKLESRDDGTYLLYVPNRYHNKIRNVLICLHPEKLDEFLQLSTSYTNQPKSFVKIKNENLIDGFFNFRLLKGVYILGLAKEIRSMRGSQSLRSFANKLEVYHHTIMEIEKKNQGIELHLLDKLLTFNDYSLMPFLESYSKSIRYKMKNTNTIKLPIKPTQLLEITAKNLRFFKHTIIINDAKITRDNLEKLFDMQIQTTHIRNKLIRDFFKLFLTLELKEVV